MYIYSFNFLRLRMEGTASIYGEQLFKYSEQRITTRVGSVVTGLDGG
jgi:hypothetical protein